MLLFDALALYLESINRMFIILKTSKTRIYPIIVSFIGMVLFHGSCETRGSDQSESFFRRKNGCVDRRKLRELRPRWR